MKVTNRRAVEVLAWVVLVAGLLYIKDRREKAYWKDVADKIASQVEPGKAPAGLLESHAQGLPTGDSVVLEGPAPAGVGESELAADTKPATLHKMMKRPWGMP
jgi:hypothetical protein